MSENAFWTQAKQTFNSPNEQDLNVFKTWNSVLSVPLYFPFQFENDYGQDFAKMFIKLSVDEQDLWKRVMREPFLGHTEDSYNGVLKVLNFDNQSFPVTPWTLKCGHHILMYLYHTQRKLSDYEQIVEFGPGIGETCRMINDLGFKGDYYLYDLPEVLRVSTFYNKDYPNVKGVTHYSHIPNNKKTLFIGTWSISEVPFDYRDEVFTHFKDADFLIIYQNRAFEYDNDTYFKTCFKEIVNKTTVTINIDWLNHIAEGNKYLFNI